MVNFVAIVTEVPEAVRQLELARAHFAFGRVSVAAAAVDHGLGLVRGSDSPAEACLAVERAKILNHATFGIDRRALDAAQHAVAVSRRAEAGEAAALLELATARFATGRAGCLRTAEEARRAFLRNRDADATLSASTWIAQMQEGWRHGREARATALATAQLAEREGKRGHAAIARWQLARFRFLGAEVTEPTLAQLRGAIAGQPLGAFRAQAFGELALALGDSGEPEQACEVLDSVAGQEHTEYDDLSRLFYRAELAFLAGRPDGAIDAILGAASVPSIIELTRDWALFALGEPPLGVSIAATRPGIEGFGLEAQAFVELRNGRPQSAAEAFMAAAARHDGQLLRHGLRCAWGAGEALLRAGRQREGRAQLRYAEELAVSSGSAAILSRIRASLRPFDRSPMRTREGLTPRQRQVLELAGRGHTTAQIATELGIARSSVETHVSAARGKLGATTRLAAAVLVRSEPRTVGPLRRDLRRVANLLARGATVKEAAADLGVSTRTAARRIAELRHAAGTSSTIAAVAAFGDDASA